MDCTDPECEHDDLCDCGSGQLYISRETLADRAGPSTDWS